MFEAKAEFFYTAAVHANASILGAAASHRAAKVALYAGFVTVDGRGTPKAVVDTSHEDLRGEFFVAAPVEGMAHKAPRGGVIALLQPGASNDEAEFGTVRMMLNSLDVETH